MKIGRESYLDSTPSLLLQKHVLGFHITVNDFVLCEGVETLEEGVSKLPDQLETKALELVLLDEFVEVEGEELKGDAGMAPECKVVRHVDDVHPIVLVEVSEVLEDSNLFLSLPMKPFLIPDHLEGHMDVGLVVKGLYDLTKAPLPYHLENLVAVAHVVMLDVDIAPLLVIVP